MSNNCPQSPPNKKEYISEIGKILVADYGKKKYYKPEEVKEAQKKSRFQDALEYAEYVDWSCWAMSMFSSHEDFDAYHLMTGETCDYVAMKTEMLAGITTSSSPIDWISMPDIDLDASWLDLGEVFSGVLEGVGEFVSGIFDVF